MTPTVKHTRVRPATCNRCGAVVLAGHAYGGHVAVDPRELHESEVVDTILAGGALWSLRSRKLFKPDVEPNGVLVGAHGCGCSPRDVTWLEAAPEDPRQAPATRGTPSGGRMRDVHALRGLKSSVAENASHHRSDPECDFCGKPCEPGLYVSAELGQSIMFAHHIGECP